VLQPLSYVLPLTYAADLLRYSLGSENVLAPGLSFAMLGMFGALLFVGSLHCVRRRWIA